MTGTAARRRHPPPGTGAASSAAAGVRDALAESVEAESGPRPGGVSCADGAAVAQLDVQLVRRAPKRDLELGAGGVLDHVRDALLHDPVEHVVQLRGKAGSPGQHADADAAGRRRGRRPARDGAARGRRRRRSRSVPEHVREPLHLGERALPGVADRREPAARRRRPAPAPPSGRRPPGPPSGPASARRCRAARARSARARAAPRAGRAPPPRAPARGCAARAPPPAAGGSGRRARRATDRPRRWPAAPTCPRGSGPREQQREQRAGGAPRRRARTRGRRARTRRRRRARAGVGQLGLRGASARPAGGRERDGRRRGAVPAGASRICGRELDVQSVRRPVASCPRWSRPPCARTRSRTSASGSRPARPRTPRPPPARARRARSAGGRYGPSPVPSSACCTSR